MRVAYWLEGGEPPANAHPNHRPMSPPPTGRHKHMYSGDGLLPISISAHLRFSFKPIVTIARISAVAEPVKLVGTLPNALRKLLDRCKQFHVLSVLLFHSGVSPSP